MTTTTTTDPSTIRTRTRLEERLLTIHQTLDRLRKDQRGFLRREVGAALQSRLLLRDAARRDFVRSARRATGLPRGAVLRCIRGVDTRDLDLLAVVRRAGAAGWFGDRRLGGGEALAAMELRALVPKVAGADARQCLEMVGYSVLHALEALETLGLVSPAAATHAQLRYILDIPRATAIELCAQCKCKGGSYSGDDYCSDSGQDGTVTFKSACLAALSTGIITPAEYSRALFCFATYLAPDTAQCLDFSGCGGDLGGEEDDSSAAPTHLHDQHHLTPCIERAYMLGLLDRRAHDVAQVRNLLHVPAHVAREVLALSTAADDGGAGESVLDPVAVRGDLNAQG
ncbi:hypothetical protein KEM52_006691 [Ascosphaera acerosa]|nr:hypothetical protein KEM52_006691 [Ascosphaera acerosa]